MILGLIFGPGNLINPMKLDVLNIQGEKQAETQLTCQKIYLVLSLMSMWFILL
jgi:hypothetical protein